MARVFPTKMAHAAEAMRRAVVAGEIRPGERVRVEHWANRLGLSLTPVREALRQLEAQGVVTITPHQGARVRQRSRAEFEKEARIRACLEQLAVDMLLEMDDASLARLTAEAHRHAEDFAAAAAVGDPAASFEHNDYFHQTLYEAAAVPKLLELMSSLRGVYSFYAYQLGPHALRQAADEHIELVSALGQRDRETAHHVVSAHVESMVAHVPNSVGGTALFSEAADRVLASGPAAARDGRGSPGPPPPRRRRPQGRTTR